MCSICSVAGSGSAVCSGACARNAKVHIAAPQLQRRPCRTQLLHALPRGDQVRQQTAQQQTDGDQRGAIGTLPAIGQHQNAGDGDHRSELEQQSTAGNQFLLLRIPVPQSRRNAFVMRALDVFALKRTHVAQTTRKIFAQPEQLRHVRHIGTADARLCIAAGHTHAQARQNRQQRCGDQQRRGDQHRDAHAHQRSDRRDQQLQHRAKALRGDLDVVGEHIGDFCRAGTGQGRQWRVDQCRMHASAQADGIAAGQACGQPCALPAQCGKQQAHPTNMPACMASPPGNAKR